MDNVLAATRRIRIPLGWLAVLSLLSLPFIAWWRSLGDPAVYFFYVTPPGQSLYVLSKLAALYALTLACLQLMWALAKMTGWVKRAYLSQALHRTLGISVVGMMSLHVALFVAAASLRKQQLAMGVLFPNFDGYYNTAVTLGLFAAASICVVAVAGALRAAGARAVKWLHMLAIPAAALAMLHSALIGTDTRNVLVASAFGFAALTIVGLLIWRVRRFALKRSILLSRDSTK